MQAFEHLQSVALVNSFIGTQSSSSVLNLNLQQAQAVLRSLTVAARAQKGDDKLWDEVVGRDVAIWV